MSSASSSAAGSSGTVSLPQHLRDPLDAVLAVLPSELAADLAPCLAPTSNAVPSRVLQHIARWARSADGLAALTAAQLDPFDYSTIALFAGTRTTPNASFVTEHKKSESRFDRKAVTALANAVFSIVGASFAGWWAAANAGWGPQWASPFAR